MKRVRSNHRKTRILLKLFVQLYRLIKRDIPNEKDFYLEMYAQADGVGKVIENSSNFSRKPLRENRFPERFFFLANPNIEKFIYFNFQYMFFCEDCLIWMDEFIFMFS